MCILHLKLIDDFRKKILTSSTGKMLGGSGSHNGMLHSRGSPKDYDNWAELLNDDSFRYMNVLKYFRKMETYVGQKIGTEGDGNLYETLS